MNGRWRIIIEYGTEQLPEEDIQAMVTNFRRHLIPSPKKIWYVLLPGGDVDGNK